MRTSVRQLYRFPGWGAAILMVALCSGWSGVLPSSPAFAEQNGSAVQRSVEPVPQRPRLAQANTQQTTDVELPDGELGELLKIGMEEKSPKVDNKPPDLNFATKARLKTIKQAYVASAVSKFSKLKEIFDGSKMMSLKHFPSDLSLTGKCVSRFEPETFVPNVANVYVEKDELLGRQVYFVPLIEDARGRRLSSLSNVGPKELLSFHNVSRERVNNFTAVQDVFPKSTPLYEMFQDRMRGALFFAYRPKLVGKESDKQDIYFRLRGGKSPEGKVFVIMERLCPYYPGCQIEANNIIDYLNYVEAYSYCYYTKVYNIRKISRQLSQE